LSISAIDGPDDLPKDAAINDQVFLHFNVKLEAAASTDLGDSVRVLAAAFGFSNGSAAVVP